MKFIVCLAVCAIAKHCANRIVKLVAKLLVSVFAKQQHKRKTLALNTHKWETLVFLRAGITVRLEILQLFALLLAEVLA